MNKVYSEVLKMDIPFSVSRVGVTTDKSGWQHTKWAVKISKAMFSFSQGMAYSRKDAPKIDDVLSCLVSDSNFADYDYWEFCESLGYKRDKESKKIFDQCIKNKNKLESLSNDGILPDLETMSELFQDY